MTLLIRIYQVTLSPVFSNIFGIHCKYDESCSRYTERVIREKGLVRGLFLGFRRFLSCW